MPPIILAVTGLGATALFLVTFALVPRGASVERRLADLERGAVARETQNGFFHKLIDDQQRSQLSRKLSAAGWYTVTPTQMVVRTVACGAAGAVLAALLVVFVGDTSIVWLCGAGGVVFAGFAAPTVLLNRAAEARQKAVQRALPDLLDMLTTTVEAGVSLNGALAAAADVVSGPLSVELNATLSDVRLGRGRAEALMAMAERIQEPELLTAVVAIVQAERLGGNVVSVLEAIAVEAREMRMTRIEELAGQLPVKMVFPMALFMLPALVVMIFGPVVARMLSPK